MNSVLAASFKVRKLFSSHLDDIIANLHNEVRRLKSKYGRLYDGSPVMQRTVDPDGRILDCNLTYVRNLGYSSKGEILGRSAFEHTAPESLDEMRKVLAEWASTGSIKNKDLWLKRKDGTVFPVLLNATNLYDEDGRLIGSNTAIIDIVEIHNARQLLEKANHMKDEFLNIAAHELRTPIQPIIGMAQLASQGQIKQEDAWKAVLKEARRLLRLANNMLDVTKIESGVLNYNIRKVSINDVIGDVIDSAQIPENSATKRRLKIVRKFDVDITMLIDEDRISQALSNIINNAVKFTTGGQVTVETSVINDKGLFEIRISDTGPGIPAEMLPNLFTKFSTKTTGNDATKHGTGLGLYIAKSIIHAHGGHILAGNNQDNGVTFVVSLPINDIKPDQPAAFDPIGLHKAETA